jgi:hypothetical protein
MIQLGKCIPQQRAHKIQPPANHIVEYFPDFVAVQIFYHFLAVVSDHLLSGGSSIADNFAVGDAVSAGSDKSNVKTLPAVATEFPR